MTVVRWRPVGPIYRAAVALNLTSDDQAALDGKRGEANRLAMRVVSGVAEAMAAERLIDITGAHVDSCLHHGRSGLDFVERLTEGGGRVTVPTTLNVSSLDLLHPELYRGDEQFGREAREVMQRYEDLGCRPTWTCAPYQLPDRPRFGEHVAWAESNAIVFANSVLGARTHRWGDFMDICAAITGRVPAAGLHVEANRLGQVLFRIEGVSALLLDRDVLYPVLGHLLGTRAGSRVPVVEGLPHGVPEDRLKALGAAAAASGAVGLIHVVGTTPEAATTEIAFGNRDPVETVPVGPLDLIAARDDLSTGPSAPLAAVSVGTPHYSVAEIGRLVELIAGRRIAAGIRFYVNTGRDVFTEARLRGWDTALEDAGITVVTDTCTYVTPVMDEIHGTAMTDSAKWAYYAPGNLGLDVVFGSVEDCVESAVAGRLVHDESVWSGG